MKARDIAIGFNEAERARVGSLYWEAFRQKLRPAFNNEAIGLRVVRAAMRADRMLVARVDGTVAGVCGYYDRGSGAADLSWRALRQVLPRGQAVRASLALSVLARQEKDRLLVLDGICGDSAHRGDGIGTALLAAAEQYARDRGLAAVRLSVIDRNPRAEKLYRRRGYMPVDRGALGLLGFVYGFDKYIVMDKELAR